MSDKPDHIEAEGELTVEQGYRLKQKIEKSITYGPGLNAREVESLKRLGADHWAKVRREYDEWIKGMQVYGNVLLMIVAAVGGFVCIRYTTRKGWVGWAAITAGMLAFYAVASLFRREGHREGYMDGYDSGFSEGINKAYGIDEKEAMDIHDRAIDMQFDERVIKAFNEKK